MSDNLIQKNAQIIKKVLIALFIITVFVYCLWSIQSGSSGNNSHYQFFVKDDMVISSVYVFDTKTSQLHLRLIQKSFNEIKAEDGYGEICFDLGTIKQPKMTLVSIDETPEPKYTLVPDETPEHPIGTWVPVDEK